MNSRLLKAVMLTAVLCGLPCFAAGAMSEEKAEAAATVQPAATATLRICVVRFKNVDKKVTSEMLPLLSKELFDIPVQLIEDDAVVPPTAYVPERKKFYGGAILDMLQQKMKPECVMMLGFVTEPLFVGRIDVNGVGNPKQGAAVVSTSRLYINDHKQFIHRLVGDSLHELGHVMELDHDPNMQCAMFPTGVEEDLGARYSVLCPFHKKKAYDFLKSKGVKLAVIDWSKPVAKPDGTKPVEPVKKVEKDTQPPKVADAYPPDGSMVKADIGSIIIRLEDQPQGGSGVDSNSVILYLDGVPTRTFFHYGRSELAARVDRLDPGPHHIQLEVSDKAGNAMMPYNSMFLVEENQ